jgi:hypothetical protein
VSETPVVATVGRGGSKKKIKKKIEKLWPKHCKTIVSAPLHAKMVAVVA